MGNYTLKQTEDEGVWVVDGLEHPFLKGRQVTIVRDADAAFKDMVQDVRNGNKNVQHGDIFDTPEGQYQIDGALVMPYEPPPPPAPPADDQAAAQQQGTGTPAGPAPVVQVGIQAVDTQGRMYQGTLDLPWPTATASEIVSAWDKVASSLSPGDVVTTIRIPGSDRRVIEIAYPGGSRVVLDIG